MSVRLDFMLGTYSNQNLIFGSHILDIKSDVSILFSLYFFNSDLSCFWNPKNDFFAESIRLEIISSNDFISLSGILFSFN